MTIGSLFTNEVFHMPPSGTLADAAKLMDERNVGTIVIAEGDRPVGIVTDRNIALALGRKGMSPLDPIQKLMRCPVTTIAAHDGIFKATQMMRETGLRRLVVMDAAGKMCGIVSLDDLLFLLGRELNNMAQVVRPEVR